jgi:hypothetical protein
VVILKLARPLLAMPAHLTFTAGLTALPFFHGPMAPVSSASRRLEGKTSAGKTLSEASRFTFHNSIGTRKGLDAD